MALRWKIKLTISVRCSLFLILNFFRNAQILEIFRGVFEAAAKVFVSAVHCDGFAGAEFEIVHGFRFNHITAEFAPDGISDNLFHSSSSIKFSVVQSVCFPLFFLAHSVFL